MSHHQIELGMVRGNWSRRKFLGSALGGAIAAGLLRDAGWAAAQQLRRAIFTHPAFVDYINVPAFVAVKKGFWRDEGIDVQLKWYVGGGPLSLAMAAGELPVATGGLFTPIILRTKNVKVKYIAGCDKRPVGWEVVAINPNIKSVGDLKGKRMGTGAPGATNHWWTLKLMEWQGWKVGTDLIIAPVGDFEGHVGTLLANRVDAIMVWPPNFPLIQAKHKEAHVVVKMTEVVDGLFGGAFEGEGWFATEEYIEKDSAVVRGLLKGYFKGVKYMTDHLDEAARITAAEWKIDPAVARAALEYGVDNFKLDGAINEAGVKLFMQDMKDAGQIEKVFPINEVVDPRFVPVKY